MPIYEYVCQSCKQTFETIRPFSQADAPINCPNCGYLDAKRQISLVNAVSSGKSLTGGSSSCGTCQSGNCGSCGHS
ncbi:MAG: zinc ribbon domain-containing protein [Anaerolineaceae bacterium]|nr:zinc ribbon domain-containing protein [Anaerolineaceae bacterium]MDI9531870.1 zinc ribbon domain-containing protein [Chloroflexota bacterium]